MNVTLFAIVFFLTIVGMLVFLFLNIKSLPVVKAGKVTKPCKEIKRIFGYMPSHILINGVKKDVSKDMQMVVCGNSMQNYHIYDGQRIYVREMMDEEKNGITRYPVLVFHIVNGEPGDAKYKLRKFVGYVDNDDLRNLFLTLQNRIKVTEDVFVSQCADKLKRLRLKNQGRLVLSETFDEDKNAIFYSLHPVNTILGKVEYAM